MGMLHSNNSSKIMHVIGALVAGGAERFVSELVQELRNYNSDVGLIALSKREDAVGNQMRLELESVGVELHTGLTRKVGARTVLWYIQKLFQKKPSIVHLHTPNTELIHYLATRVYRVPHRIYRTLHSVRQPGSLIMRLAMRANNVTNSIACGHAVYEVYCKCLKDKVITVENGVRFSWPIRTQGIASEAKIRCGFEDHRCHFLIVGRMNNRNLLNSPKGHDVLIEAWKRGRLGSNNCVLHILGDGNLRGQLTALVEGDNSVIFHGIQPNIYEWLLASDCFVMPSRYEGLPIAGIEAAGTGLPCVFSDIPPLRDLRVPRALWVPIDNPDLLSQALLIVANARPAVDASEVHEFRRRFDIKHTARRYAEVYTKQ